MMHTGMHTSKNWITFQQNVFILQMPTGEHLLFILLQSMEENTLIAVNLNSPGLDRFEFYNASFSSLLTDGKSQKKVACSCFFCNKSWTSAHCITVCSGEVLLIVDGVAWTQDCFIQSSTL